MTQILAAKISGHGPAIVMIHGYLASGHYFSKLRKRLERDHTVITIDLLGHGHSPKPNTLAYSYADHIQAIHHTLQALKIERPFVIVGHSMGALLALRYAREFPDSVNKVLLFNPPMFSSPEEALHDLAATGMRYRLMLFSRAGRHLWRAVRMLPRNPWTHRHPVSFSDMLRVPAAAREGSLRNVVMEGNVFREVEDISQPTMIIVGKKDRHVYLKNAIRAQWPPHVRLKLNTRGHNGIGFYPQQAERYIRQHLGAE
jgi:pimeloyl-ACP methyl ester carboxylesterase